MTGAMRVLIVDDNPDDRALAARELAGEFPDIGTIEIADATTFETALERGGFDLVITEFRLAWSDGLSVFRELKYRYPEIPVIMFTGAGSEEIAVEAMRAGLDDYVLKSPDHVVRLPVVVAAALDHARDRQARREAEEALRSSEAHLRALFASMSAVILVLDRDGRYLEVAPTSPELLYRPAAETLGKTVHELFSPEQADHFLEAVRRALDTHSTVEIEYTLQIGGEDMRFAASISPMLEDSVVLVARDITERKRAEEELRHSHERIRELLGHLFRAQEEERARISGDIHDDSIQVMSAVGMRLEALRRRLTDPEALESLQPLAETVTSAIARLRHLMFELRPRVLDEDGLAPALRVCLDHMAEQVQIECTLSNRLEQEPALAARTVLYRIAQEALVNIRKHANAKHVEVVLEPREAGYAVRITDDGSGCDVGGAERTLPGHLGLAAMRERAEMVGGRWRIESTPGEGTTVEFWVPAEMD